MAKIETFKCDLCGKESTISMSFFDTAYSKQIKTTDICEEHFNAIRSYIRKGCPKVSV